MAKSRPQRGQTAAPSRLPSTRERRPALAALAVLLIVGGALASGWLAMRAGDRVEFVQVKNEIAQGQEIAAEDLQTVRLPKDLPDAVPASDMDDLVGNYAATRLLPATIVVTNMVSYDAGADAGMVQVSVPVDPLRLPENLTSGSNVILYVASQDGGGGQAVLSQVIGVRAATASGGIASEEGLVVVEVSVSDTCGGVIGAAGSDPDTLSVGLVGDVDESTQIQTTCERR